MKHRYASDCHSHSDCSFDGRSSMNAMCERALELGLFYYTVSDHCECNEYKYTEYRSTDGPVPEGLPPAPVAEGD